LVKSILNLKDILVQNPFSYQKDLDANHIYFVLLKGFSVKARKELFENQKFINEEFRVNDYCVPLNCKSGYAKAKLNNNLVEKRLKVSAKMRYFKTMNPLLEIAETV